MAVNPYEKIADPGSPTENTFINGITNGMTNIIP